MPKRIVVIANKAWEADPLCGALLSSKARPRVLDGLAWTYPGYPTKVATAPRITLTNASLGVEIWSIEDVFGPRAVTVDKPPVIDKILAAGAAPALVIAFGTAAFPSESSFNGCATMGAAGFMYDTDPSGGYKDPSVGILLPAHTPTGFFDSLGKVPDFRAQTEMRFFRPPMNSAKRPLFFGAENYAALGVINVTHYDDYAWADLEGVEAIRTVFPHYPIGSVETTHALIRSRTTAPFVWISGITDRVGYFNQEVGPRDYAQNTTAAHNAGIVAAWLLGSIFDGAIAI